MQTEHLLIIGILLLIVAYAHMNLETARRAALRAGVPAAELACASLWRNRVLSGRPEGMGVPDPQVTPGLTLGDTLTHAKRWEQERMRERSAQRRMATEQVKGG